MTTVKQWMADKAMSLRQFGELVGCGESHISRVVSRERQPSLRLLQKMAEVTGIPVAKLLEEILA